jgi:Profilin
MYCSKPNFKLDPSLCLLVSIQGRRALCHLESYLLDIAETLERNCASSPTSFVYLFVTAKSCPGNVYISFRPFHLVNPVPTAYVDTNLVGTGRISRAAIVGQQGGVWAASPGYTVRTTSLCEAGINIVASCSYPLLSRMLLSMPSSPRTPLTLMWD